MRQLKITKTITNRESVSFDKYMQEIGKVKMISPEEEVFLCQQVKMGSKKALDQLIKVNLRFVVSVAKQYQGQGLSLCDLVNEGNIGLIHAAKRFDDTRGFKFISFAVWWIRQGILQAIAGQAQMVRIPINKSLLRNKIKKAGCLLEQELGRAPSTEELAEAMNAKLEDIEDCLGINGQHISLDSPISNDEESNCLIDTIENPNAENSDSELSHESSLKIEIGRHLELLTGRQKETICYYFGIGEERALSLDDIARKFDLTPERVRQIKDKALMKLKASCNFQVLKTYL